MHHQTTRLPVSEHLHDHLLVLLGVGAGQLEDHRLDPSLGQAPLEPGTCKFTRNVRNGKTSAFLDLGP